MIHDLHQLIQNITYLLSQEHSDIEVVPTYLNRQSHQEILIHQVRIVLKILIQGHYDLNVLLLNNNSSFQEDNSMNLKMQRLDLIIWLL